MKSVRLIEVFDAPRELVFAAWTEPEQLKQWWGPGFFATVSAMVVATGRSRAALFASRSVAASAITVALLAVALVVATAPVGLAGSAQAPSLSQVAQRVAAVLVFGTTAALACAAIATFVRSRGSLMASVIAGTFVSLELLRVGFLGGFRAVFPIADFLRMTGSASSISVSISLLLAIAVLVALTVTAVVAGGWWTQRIEVT